MLTTITPLRKTKSLSDITVLQHEISTKSIPTPDSYVDSPEIIYAESESNTTKDGNELQDSGIEVKSSHVLQVLDGKIDKLSDIVSKHTEMLADVQLQLYDTSVLVKQVTDICSEVASSLVKRAVENRFGIKQESDDSSSEASDDSVKSSAKVLLDALEYKHKNSVIDEIIKTELTNFMQSKELRDHLTSATTSSLQTMIRDSLSKDLAETYLPLLHRSHRNLQRQVTRNLQYSFRDIEKHASSFFRCTFKMLRTSMERHQRLLENTAAPNRKAAYVIENTVKETLGKEFSMWRRELMDILQHQPHPVPTAASFTSSEPEDVPASPLQPLETGTTLIEQLMSTAVLNFKLESGDFNGCFEKALSASDLALVMSACRAADPDRLFSPCVLEQNVLLSLIQQLATDMVHDTQLKCRYLEDAILNLDQEDPITKIHMPAVLKEVCNYLSDFLRTYPSHICGHRIRMLIMAAGSLLSKEEHIELTNKTLNISHSYNS